MINQIKYRGAKFVRHRTSIEDEKDDLKNRLLDLLRSSGIGLDMVRHRILTDLGDGDGDLGPKFSLSFGRFSALLSSEGMYVSVTRKMAGRKPYYMYQVGFPGGSGDAVSKKPSDIVHAIKQYFSDDSND